MSLFQSTILVIFQLKQAFASIRVRLLYLIVSQRNQTLASLTILRTILQEAFSSTHLYHDMILYSVLNKVKQIRASPYRINLNCLPLISTTFARSQKMEVHFYLNPFSYEDTSLLIREKFPRLIFEQYLEGDYFPSHEPKCKCLHCFAKSLKRKAYFTAAGTNCISDTVYSDVLDDLYNAGKSPVFVHSPLSCFTPNLWAHWD